MNTNLEIEKELEHCNLEKEDEHKHKLKNI